MKKSRKYQIVFEESGSIVGTYGVKRLSDGFIAWAGSPEECDDMFDDLNYDSLNESGYAWTPPGEKPQQKLPWFLRWF